MNPNPYIPDRPKAGKSETAERSPVVRCLAEIEPTEVQWLWPHRIPLGRLTLVVGRPGEGKSFFTMELAAHVSTGTNFPDCSYCPSGSVLIVSAEDDPADTIRPRLDAAEADVNRVHILTGIEFTASDGKKEERAFTLADIPMLEATLDGLPDCRLVIIDPIGSFLGGGVDAHRDNEVRSILGPLAALAAKYNVAVVMVAHRRKSSGDFADDSALGSRAFTGIARAVWHLSRDPDDPKRRLLLPGKNNLTAEGDGLAFRLEGQPTGRIVWENGPVTMTADDAQLAEARSAAAKRKPGPRADARQQAAQWLGESLADGPKTPTALEEDAEKHGHKWRTVQRAADDLEIVRLRSEFGGAMLWYLPGQEPCQDRPAPPCQDSQEAENVASWQDCENQGKTPDLPLGTDDPAKMPSSTESGENRPSRKRKADSESEPPRKRKPKPKPEPLFEDAPRGLPD